MKSYVLTYARTVYPKADIRAEDEEAAMAEAYRLEDAGELGLRPGCLAKTGSYIDAVTDYDVVWEVEEGGL